MASFYKWKTFWLALAGIAAAIGAYQAGEMNTVQLLEAIFAAVGLIFVRHGVEKSGLNGKVEKPDPALITPPRQ